MGPRAHHRRGGGCPGADPAISAQIGRGDARAGGEARAGCRRDRPRRAGRPLAERAPGRRLSERADRPGRHAAASPRARPPAPYGADAPSPARRAPGRGGRAVRKAPSAPRRRYGRSRPAREQAAGRCGPRPRVPAAWKKGPGGPSAERYGERERERGRREGDPPAASPRPSPPDAGRAPSTGQRRPGSPTG